MKKSSSKDKSHQVGFNSIESKVGDLRVIIFCNPSLETFRLSNVVRAGYSDDPTSKEGMAHLVEHCVYLGSSMYPSSKDLGRELSRYGGDYNAETSTFETKYEISGLKEYTLDAIDSTLDFLLFPSFNLDDFENEKEVVIEEAKDGMYSPNVFAIPEYEADKFGIASKIFGSVVGTPSILKNISQYDLHMFHKRFYYPANMALVVESPLPVEEVLRHLAEKKYLYNGVNKKAKRTRINYKRLSKKRMYKFQKRDNQHALVFSFYYDRPISAREDLIGNLVEFALGNSNIVDGVIGELRGKGLAFNSRVEYLNFNDISSLIVRVDVASEKKLKDVINTVGEYLINILKNGMPSEMFEVAKNKLRHKIITGMNDNITLGNEIAESILLSNGFTSSYKQMEILKKITLENTNAYLKKILKSKRIIIFATGKKDNYRSQAKEILKKMSN